MSDDRPRKSWRDIDKQRDKSEHRRDGATGGGGFSQQRRERGQKSYRAALERAFDSGKIGELARERMPESAVDEDDAGRLELLKKLKEAEGRDAITKAADALLAEHALPRDFDALAKLLEHRSPSRQQDAIELLLEMTETETPRRPRAIVGQLKMIRDLGDDDELVALARQLLERLD
ncbi:MAG: hypothetical protein KC503_14530 [Myxococcales bacterium]|nr:hypothetical protein [Myxococcales bacterium]